MDRPSFSIVIPTHQRRESVCATLKSLERQTYPGPVELIVVADGCTDGTAAAVARLDGRLPLQLIEQDNRGAAAARNRGASQASGDILLFLDDDMIAKPDLIDQHARMYLAGADAVTGRMQRNPCVESGFRCGEPVAVAVSSPTVVPETVFDILTGQFSVRREVFFELGGFDESFTAEGRYGNEDIDFGARLVERFDIRHNREAISEHLTTVSPREYLERARLLGSADVQFARKHPQLARELFELRGASRPSSRFIYRPLSRLPLVSRLLAGLAKRAAEIGLRTPLRSGSTVARLFSTAYLIRYWSTAERGLRLLKSKQLR